SDLFDRINGFPIKISPLRERKEDIPMLAGYFFNRYATREGKTLPSLTKSTMDLLQSHPWPGNMRELQWVMERFVSFYEAESISIGTKWAPRESISATHLLPVGIRRTGTNPKDLLEHALMEMLVELLAGNLEAPVNSREYGNGEVDRSN